MAQLRATRPCRAARPRELPERLRFNHWALAGEWTIGPENVVLDRAGGSIAFRFHARDAHLVLSPGARKQISLRLLLDDEPPDASGGVDVDDEGNGLLRDGAGAARPGRGVVAVTVGFAALGAYLRRHLRGAAGLVLFSGALPGLWPQLRRRQGREQHAIGLLFGLGLLLGLLVDDPVRRFAA